MRLARVQVGCLVRIRDEVVELPLTQVVEQLETLVFDRVAALAGALEVSVNECVRPFVAASSVSSGLKLIAVAGLAAPRGR